MNEEIEEWLGRFFSVDEISKLRYVLIQVSDERTLGLCDLIAGWYRHVRKVERDLELLDVDRSVWGLHDLVAALSLRDFVSVGIRRLDVRLSAAAAAAVQDVDERFLGYTEPDGSGRVERFSGLQEKARDWWWKRIPVTGPIRREMDAIDARLGGLS